MLEVGKVYRLDLCGILSPEEYASNINMLSDLRKAVIWNFDVWDGDSIFYSSGHADFIQNMFLIVEILRFGDEDYYRILIGEQHGYFPSSLFNSLDRPYVSTLVKLVKVEE